MTDYPNSFGEYVQKKRNERGLTKSEVARRASFTPQYMRDIEDNRTVPSEEKIEILVGILDLDAPVAFKLADKLPLSIIKQAKKDYYGGD